MHPRTFALAQLNLLATEQRHELKETTGVLASSASGSNPKALARAGLAILNLLPRSQKTGLGGKTVVELGLDPAVQSQNQNQNGMGELPPHQIRTGDVVAVQKQVGGGAGGGVRRTGKSNKKDKGFGLQDNEEGAEEGKSARRIEGVVTRVGERAVWLALGKGVSSGTGSANGSDDDLEIPGGKLWLYGILSPTRFPITRMFDNVQAKP